MSEYQDFVGFRRRIREFVHGAAARAFQELGVADAASVHTRAAQKHACLAGEQALEHALGVVIAIRRFLLGFGRNDGIPDQEDRELRCWVSLEQRLREPKRIIERSVP